MRRWIGTIVTTPLLCVTSVHAWELQRDEDGIRIETRAVAGSDVAEFRGTTHVAAGDDEIRAVMSDVARFPEWFPDCEEAKTLSNDGSVEIRYVVTGAPWPIQNRDAVYRFETATGPRATTIDIRVTPDAHPLRDGHVRVEKAAGLWTFTPKDDGTQVEWVMHLEPGGSLPAWLINQRVVDTPFEALKGLRERAEQRAR